VALDGSAFQEGKRQKKISILGVLFLFLQFQPGTKVQNLLTNHTNQHHLITVLVKGLTS
jgi:hypothetical protein